MGGLGNQLFQIATGYAHAKKINSQYAINYNLNHIGFGQGHHPQKYKETLYKKIPVTNRNITSVFEEKGFIEVDEKFVITGGVPVGVPGTTNYLSVLKLS